MDTIFSLPLFILAVIQVLVTALHLIPGVGLPVSQSLRALMKNAASKAVVFTFATALALLGASSLFELHKGAEKVKQGSLRGEVLATVDFLRVQVSCALSLSNLLLLLLNLALSHKSCELDRTQKNMQAMQRQVKGLQTEYERVTAAERQAGGGDGGGGGGGGGGSLAAEEAAALRKTLDRLIAEKQQLQDASEAAERAAKAAEAKVTAMVSQIKGYDKEFDRMLDENKALKNRMAQMMQSTTGVVAADAVGGLGAMAAMGPPLSKKDD